MPGLDDSSLRREFLAAGVTGAMIGLAGCISPSNIETLADAIESWSDGDGRPSTEPPASDLPIETDPAPTATVADSESTTGRIETSAGATAGWVTGTDGDADATVVDEETLNLRVHKCSTAAATKRLGDISGELRISFDYELEAESWYEKGLFAVIEDGEEIYNTEEGGEARIAHSQGTTETGSVSETIPVDGDVQVAFRIRPSSSCGAFDHGNTYFRVSNIELTTVP